MLVVSDLIALSSCLIIRSLSAISSEVKSVVQITITNQYLMKMPPAGSSIV